MPPSSPKRCGMILDAPVWPLRDSMISDAESVASSVGLFDAEPVSPLDGGYSSGLHFSTTNADVDPIDFHLTAARLLSGGASTDQQARGLVGEAIGHSACHREEGVDRVDNDPFGRSNCACGRAFSTPFRLRQHAQHCSSTREPPDSQAPQQDCTSCLSIGNVPDAIVADQTVPCASISHGTASLHVGTLPTTASINVLRRSISQRFWIYDGDHRWAQLQKATLRDCKDSGCDFMNDTEDVEQSVAFVKRLLKRPISHDTRESCDLCGELMRINHREFTRHMREHSLEFADKCHRCDKCHISFANEIDLERHLQSAYLTQHCGLAFRHVNGSCDGHHPPTYIKSSTTTDHELMQHHLWTWELCQLHAHRIATMRLDRNFNPTAQQDMLSPILHFQTRTPFTAADDDTRRSSHGSTEEYFHGMIAPAITLSPAGGVDDSGCAASHPAAPHSPQSCASDEQHLPSTPTLHRRPDSTVLSPHHEAPSTPASASRLTRMKTFIKRPVLPSPPSSTLLPACHARSISASPTYTNTLAPTSSPSPQHARNKSSAARLMLPLTANLAIETPRKPSASSTNTPTTRSVNTSPATAQSEAAPILYPASSPSKLSKHKRKGSHFSPAKIRTLLRRDLPSPHDAQHSPSRVRGLSTSSSSSAKIMISRPVLVESSCAS